MQAVFFHKQKSMTQPPCMQVINANVKKGIEQCTFNPYNRNKFKKNNSSSDK